MTKKGFTLIELLIVVAIIAILAAIAVPNFLEAQTRAKVSRVKADQRSVATAIESYAVDFGKAPIGYMEAGWCFNPPYRNPYPNLNDPYNWPRLWAQLTTPVSYMSSVPKDPFFIPGYVNGMDPATTWFRYYCFEYQFPELAGNMRKTIFSRCYKSSINNGVRWCLESFGPIGANTLPFDYFAPLICGHYVYAPPSTLSSLAWIYDATNGTVSQGGVYRSSAGVVTGFQGGSTCTYP